MLAHVGNIQWCLTLVYVCDTYTKSLHHYTFSSQGAIGEDITNTMDSGQDYLESIYSSKSNMVIIVNMHYVVVNNQPPLER